MDRRLILQTKFEEILGSRNVYYNPPKSVMLKYPAIVYKDKSIDSLYANDKAYRLSKSYEVTLIDNNPDNDLVEKLLELRTCRFDRHYKADNLNHYTFTLYF